MRTPAAETDRRRNDCAAIVLGLAAGMLALDDIRGDADFEGDETALRAIFGA